MTGSQIEKVLADLLAWFQWAVRDEPVTLVLHVALLSVAVVAWWLGRVVPRWRRARSGGEFVAVVTRGDENMAFLYMIYGASVFLFTQVATTTDGLQGYRAGVLVVDYSILTYLFFFNEWWRTRMIRLRKRLREERP